ncbi:ATP-binding cassette domain-containing protein [Microlunatus speluncae]|uniref:ATP-binding cassette domain-containing protein n=1 Tax=Microlunatus speluncae TaxID=2594267 RepID=UPI001FE7B51A|nr:ATP-binding cassette domain-containing protein [Microlunatus speluncae]
MLIGLIELRRELGLPAVDRVPPPVGDRTANDAPVIAAEVRLTGVSFGYPTRDTRAVSNVTLHIPPGQSIAIVGVNGAGKSTLIKLLCGLYTPDEGTVLVDQADPAVEEDARRKVAVIFQDFVRYQLSLRDNVRLGAGTDDHDQELLDRALVDAGGATVLERLDHGWDTVLSAEYEGGTDLSGGQWQRVALARALAAVAGGAGVLILDEPTAALDVRAEAALFDRFLEVTRGVTTILVSHRLSSVRHADRIVVLGDPADSGQGIVEDGTHEELMRRGGRYSRLFSLQASRFAQTGRDASDDPGPVIR